MLDPFLSTHHEICLVPGFHRIEPDLMERVRVFVQETYIGVPQAPELKRTRHVQTHERIFRSYLESAFVHMRIRQTEMEKTIFEAVTLHRLIISYMRANVDEFERRSHSVLTAMLKRKLIDLFIDLHPEDLPVVWRLGEIQGMRVNSWITACEHAMACVRTIRMISRVEECWMYFPDVYESYLLGADLIVFTENDRVWCAQIARPAAGDDTFHICHARSVESDPWVDRLIMGVNHFTTKYPGYTFAPCVITQPNDGSTVTVGEITCLRTFLMQAETASSETAAA